MIELNNLHPMVRYGIAAALVRLPDLETDLNKRADLWILAKKALEDKINELLLYPTPAKDGVSIRYKPLPATDFKSRKNAANGYFIAPHVLTSQNAAGIIDESAKLIGVLGQEDAYKNYELKRSFAPMIAKINAGKKSMSNPKVDTLEAAFTCIATLTPLKPAAFIKTLGDKFSNTGIIPDLPLIDEETGEQPMVDFIKLFDEIISHGVGENAYVKKPDKDKKFPRPNIFYGNYPNRPKTFGIGIVGLVAAIGKWAKEHDLYYDTALKTLEYLQNRPIYLVSYNGSMQEKYGHHIVKLAKTGELHLILQHLPRVSLIGVEEMKKYSDPKWQLFTRSFDQFLQFFNESTWQNFLAHRATYPIEFFQLLKSYFMQTEKYTEAVINSAVAYGKSLNGAASLAAYIQFEEDKKFQRNGRTKIAYKYQYLLQLESIIGSAESGAELIARLNSQVGRLTMRDVSNESEVFFKAVCSNQILIGDARHLITAFMRLSTYNPSKKEDASVDESEETTDAESEIFG